MAAVTGLLILLTGVVLWWPASFSQPLRSISILLHDVCFIGFFAAIVGHIYLGTAAEPGTFRSMTRGTVTKAWAKLHHPRWYREVMGDRRS
jgi:formate dehydrogenase subunit gamma